MVDEILALQRQLTEAELSAGTDRLEALLAEDFRSVGDQGFVLGKRQLIELAGGGDFRYLGIDSSEIDVRCYDRTAIVLSVRRTRAVWRDEAMELTVRAGHVWVQQADGWKLASVQYSPLAG